MASITHKKILYFALSQNLELTFFLFSFLYGSLLSYSPKLHSVSIAMYYQGHKYMNVTKTSKMSIIYRELKICNTKSMFTESFLN